MPGYVIDIIFPGISPDYPGKPVKSWKRQFLKASTTWLPIFRRFQSLGVVLHQKLTVFTGWLHNCVSSLLRQKHWHKITSNLYYILPTFCNFWKYFLKYFFNNFPIKSFTKLNARQDLQYLVYLLPKAYSRKILQYSTKPRISLS